MTVSWKDAKPMRSSGTKSRKLDEETTRYVEFCIAELNADAISNPSFREKVLGIVDVFETYGWLSDLQVETLAKAAFPSWRYKKATNSATWRYPRG